MELQAMKTSDRPKNRRKTFCANCGSSVQSNVEITIPGINRLKDPAYGKTCKLVWIIIILICSATSLYFTVDRLIEYFNYPTNTKTELHRNSNIKYPAFSICSFGFMPFFKAVTNDVESVCKTRFSTYNSTADCKDIPLQEMNISIDDVWNRINSFHVKLNEVFLDNRDMENDDFTGTKTKFFFGNCEVITHNTFTPFVAISTQLTLEIESNYPEEKLDFVIILHGQPAKSVNGWEFLHSQSEDIKYSHYTQFKITEEKFQLKNKSGQECYNLIYETQKAGQCVLDYLKSFNICRLPFLTPDSFVECKSYSDLKSSAITILHVIAKTIPKLCSLRKICDDSTYAISVDYVMRNEESNGTEMTIKFASDITTIQYEYYSYSFPALVSDLFAYWGFFACLNAFIFVEIFEFAFSKIYFTFKNRFS